MLFGLFIGFLIGVAVGVTTIITLAFWGCGEFAKSRKMKSGCIWAKYPLSAFDTDMIEYVYIVDAKPNRKCELELLVLDCDENGDCKSDGVSEPRRMLACRLVKQGYEFYKNLNKDK
jgi:hypothetical protein